jgi:hypothetical protein
VGNRLGHRALLGDGRLRLDAVQLYNDFLAFLDREASHPRNQRTRVWVGESFRFKTGTVPAPRGTP